MASPIKETQHVLVEKMADAIKPTWPFLTKRECLLDYQMRIFNKKLLYNHTLPVYEEAERIVDGLVNLKINSEGGRPLIRRK